MNKSNTYKIAIIGLGYVGLPLALAFKNFFKVCAFDTNRKKVYELKKGYDFNKQFQKKDFKNKKNIIFSNRLKDLKESNIYIIAVPTPIKKKNLPDLKPLSNACNLVSKVLKKKDIVIFESTVYPTTTENYCAKILAKKSGLKYNQDFFCGYSPERINPGDKNRKLEKIIKITSGSTKKTSLIVNNLYKKIIKAGTFNTESIQVAEAAKIIENAQRDINIAFINEVKIIFDKMGIDIFKVLKAASTKWNFLNFTPGLVGGHCIGVDPYYLSYISQKYKFNPKVILSGRSTNNLMSKYEANFFINLIKKNNNKSKIKKVLILGCTFKENCSDLRNSKVFDLIKFIKKYNIDIDVYDPIANYSELSSKLNKLPLKNLNRKKIKYDGVFIAQNHLQFKKIGLKKIEKLCYYKNNIYDFKQCFKK